MVLAFSKTLLGCSAPAKVEALALREALQGIHRLQLNNTILEMDCKEVVDAWNNTILEMDCKEVVDACHSIKVDFV